MEISQFRQIAEAQSGTVLIDGKSKDTESPELKTASLKGRLVRFFKGESSSRNAEVKQAFLEAVKKEYGDEAAASVKKSLGSDRKPLTTRVIQKVLEHQDFVKDTMRQIGRQIMEPLIPKDFDKGTSNLDQMLQELGGDEQPKVQDQGLRMSGPISNEAIDELFDDLDSATLEQFKSPLPRGTKVEPSGVSLKEGKVELSFDDVLREFEGSELFDLTDSGEARMGVGQFNDLRESLSPGGRARAGSDPIPEEEMQKLLADLEGDGVELETGGTLASEGLDFTGKTEEETRKMIFSYLFESDDSGELVVDRKTAGETYVAALKEDSKSTGVDFTDLNELLEELDK